MTCGVYCITHRASGRKYVGMSVDVERRWKAHAAGQSGNCRWIKAAIRKYGWSAFDASVLEVCEKESAGQREQYWIATLGTLAPNGFNLTSGGEGCGGASEETRAKKSESLRRVAAARTPEQRSEIIRRGHARQTPERRSEIVRKSNAAQSPEQRSDRVRRANAALTPEQRSERVRRSHAQRTSECYANVSRGIRASSTPEQRSERARKAWATRRANQERAA